MLKQFVTVALDKDAANIDNLVQAFETSYFSAFKTDYGMDSWLGGEPKTLREALISLAEQLKQVRKNGVVQRALVRAEQILKTDAR